MRGEGEGDGGGGEEGRGGGGVGRGKSTGGGVGGCPGCVELRDGGGCGIKEEVRDERGGGGGGGRRRESDLVHSGHQLGHQLVDTSWGAVDTCCLAGQVNYTIDLQL